MNNIEELSELMVELFENNITATQEKIEITDRGRQIINEISDYAEQTRLFQENKSRGEIFNNATAPQVYGYMLDRIANAPTRMHMYSSTLLIMPFLKQKLQEE